MRDAVFASFSSFFINDVIAVSRASGNIFDTPSATDVKENIPQLNLLRKIRTNKILPSGKLCNLTLSICERERETTHLKLDCRRRRTRNRSM